MKLSDAIRAGCAIRPKNFRRLWGFVGGESEAYGSCALGAAFEGLTGEIHHDEHFALRFLKRTYPILETFAQCPHQACKDPVNGQFDILHRGQTSISALIMHLNDRCGWTREAISEWVGTLEAREARATPVQLELPSRVEAAPATVEATLTV